MFSMDLEDFLEQSAITKLEWNNSQADWNTLSQIANDFEKHNQALSSAAEQISSRIRTFPGVHSVRWRIKNTLHLLKKIVRKKLDKNPKEKWITISHENYLDVVTDLIGIRALHLFKDECIAIDNSIREAWDLNEEAVMYIREGDGVPAAITERGCRAAIHDAGYRSIHYIIESRPEKKTLFAEVQVRTIFQEGWSEIDHKVRYPDFSDNEHISVFLDLFNGLAGSADEMGSFVKDLVKLLKVGEEEKSIAIQERKLAIQERDQAIADMSDKLNELDTLKKQDKKSADIINKLKTDLDKIRHSQSVSSKGEYNSQTGKLSRNGIKSVIGFNTIDNIKFGHTISSSSIGKALQSLKSLQNFDSLSDGSNNKTDKDD
ncbi:hypothetical protein KW837_26690 [Pseudomonas sp. PDM24]|uniref:hypothetical protein n=1 Tax=Pseudomonas sp. PDM24 TaxID=2854777 RepID=UPI001C47E1D6|nr:hypothetical protein [Pseudomonas sp. PDM24]MBV7497861.1 hypothetical protein [Pseudomonas sp. PDM24]